jgi:hypothetical protein
MAMLTESSLRKLIKEELKKMLNEAQNVQISKAHLLGLNLDHALKTALEKVNAEAFVLVPHSDGKFYDIYTGKPGTMQGSYVQDKPVPGGYKAGQPAPLAISTHVLKRTHSDKGFAVAGV